MFPTLGLFQSLSCPEGSKCIRPWCLFSHANDAFQQPLIASVSASRPKARSSATTSTLPSTVPAKRSHELSTPATSLARKDVASEPPSQRVKTVSTSRSVAPQTTAHGNGAPILRVTPAHSQVAVPVRQTMLKNLYDHFIVLYEAILPSNPTLASEHALRQEEEIYNKSTKLTYRNAVINSIAALKRRPVPSAIAHPSVGTEGDIAARIESQKQLSELRLTRTVVQQLVMTLETMKNWGYITEVPPGEGGSKPDAKDQVKQCERCGQPFSVRKDPKKDECCYHWGRPFNKKINGEKLRFYSCCSKNVGEDGCSWGCHVFYESDASDLHTRHAFSPVRPPKSSDGGASVEICDTALDVVALDCEMIYTTGGMRVARVSVVDGTGKEVFDELIRMDDGVDIIDYNTRFSGICQEKHEKAFLTLSSARQSLDAFINSETIIIGHALENDLKTLRIIHHRCIDTVVLFPHRAGPPYRRSLRDLAKEHLGIVIQAGDGSSGHSSVEDSVATLDLVRWYILNKVTPKKS
ncbi:ribonuclease H-like protein [Pisolithus orientalis]|uniref:ribonuclease H-like protein n=1 Tax=Pisolithus orientalis TaxID=936130 RepID=UPI00222418F2|nr:ribonuclease H-like protein [Pisolithus orientalis]KAI6035160.1 ribonuclease H-like protein [Pisolithus orientalis]